MRSDASSHSGARDDEPYGYELLIDLHQCDPSTFSRRHIDNFFSELCELIDMEKCIVHFWDDVGVPPEEQQTLPHTKGTSAVCFILTSSIVVHTLDLMEAVYINIFSCKWFDEAVAQKFAADWFRGETRKSTFLERI